MIESDGSDLGLHRWNLGAGSLGFILIRPAVKRWLEQLHFVISSLMPVISYKIGGIKLARISYIHLKCQ
jgi:hypothetical protein